MTIGHKSSSTQTYRLMLYQRALHPELFALQGRRLLRNSDYEVETWICAGGHIVRFQIEGHCLTEAVIEDGDHLPEIGLVHALPCMGEKEFELTEPGRIRYVTTIQTEALTDNLYLSTYRELRDLADENDAIFHEWTTDVGHTYLSLMDVQRYKSEFHVQSYHLMGSVGIVLRTQSIFEIKTG